ncbi:hypothetical protein AB0I81_22755 [Nonomuraea sp. NPDC050404]|uniref:hypothetical protein n=1 Tax=Nonomuraea sp. NPDC050404 TaxID=3155783 RepID=UPI0034097057
MTVKRVVWLAIPMVVLGLGGYALVCSLTDTWRAESPSVHVMCMALVAIGEAMAAIVISSMEGDRDA